MILPGAREHLQYVSDKSMVNEFRNGQMVRESDNNVFTTQWLKKHWLDWEGVEIVHDDGRLEAPAACTIENRIIVANSRPQTFILWLQEMSRQLAAKVNEQKEQEKEAFRTPSPVSLGQTES